MPILKRALLTIAGNVIVIFVLALLARNYILNPDLLAIERASDQRDIQRFEQALDRYRLNLEGRIKRIYAAAGVLESLDSSINWQPIIQHLAKIGGYEELDYFILADDSGQNALLQAGEFVDRDNSAPSQKALNEILAHILPKLERHNLATISGLYKSKADGPIAYAAGHASWSSKKLPSVYIAVRRLNHTMIPSFTEALGLSAQAISEQTLKEELKSNNVELGVRSNDDTLLTQVYGDDGEPLISLRFKTAPRAFDDNTFSPTLMVAMFAVAASWSIVFIYLYYNMITPVRRISNTMQIIRQTNNYNKHLVYKNNDDLGLLVKECNELLKHVSQHTEKLSIYSYEDALTSIGNRRYFQEQLEFNQRVAKRKEMPLSAIVFDLDYFKQYNDTYGHDGGDKVLKQFSKILSKTFTRETDVIARTGGEEFIVVLLDSNQALALQLAQRALTALGNQNIPHSGSAISDRVTVSAGVATLAINETSSAETLITQADEALYRAKQQGRNQVSE